LSGGIPLVQYTTSSDICGCHFLSQTSGSRWPHAWALSGGAHRWLQSNRIDDLSKIIGALDLPFNRSSFGWKIVAVGSCFLPPRSIQQNWAAAIWTHGTKRR